MDLWVVAAAAGAGYIAKNLQNLSLDRKESLGGPPCKSHSYNNIQSESRNFLQQLREKTCPIRRLAQIRAQDDDEDDEKNHSDFGFSEIDLSSNRDGDALEKNGMLEDYNMGWNLVFSTEKSLEFEYGESRNFTRINRGNTRCRCVQHSVRPLNSLGSSVDAQLCRENICLYPVMSTVRPVSVTDGSQIISKSGSSNSPSAKFEGCREERRRKQFGSFVGKKCSGNVQLSSSSDEVFGKSFHSQGPDTMLLFVTGMTVGIMFASVTWKDEVDKLNKQLKQMEKLVLDLHEELDVKEMLMVKELPDEGGENDMPLSTQEPIASPSDMKIDSLTKFDSLKADDRSTIEAELQVELEMLEHNLRASALERISGVVELDPDFEPDIVEGDLNLTMINDESESENETAYMTNNRYQPANYVVSPWELSLRLHELIESRLQTRIKELEIALANSQNRAQVLSSHTIVSGRRFSYSETESSSTHQSPTCICCERDKIQDGTLVENFSSNCVDSYKAPNGILLSVINKDQEKENGEYESVSHYSAIMGEDRSLDLVQEDVLQIWDKHGLTSFMSNEDFPTEDEGTDELEMLLIKQIVERRKSGSSFNLKID